MGPPTQSSVLVLRGCGHNHSQSWLLTQAQKALDAPQNSTLAENLHLPVPAQDGLRRVDGNSRAIAGCKGCVQARETYPGTMPKSNCRHEKRGCKSGVIQAGQKPVKCQALH